MAGNLTIKYSKSCVTNDMVESDIYLENGQASRLFFYEKYAKIHIQTVCNKVLISNSYFLTLKIKKFNCKIKNNSSNQLNSESFSVDVLRLVTILKTSIIATHHYIFSNALNLPAVPVFLSFENSEKKCLPSES